MSKIRKVLTYIFDTDNKNIVDFKSYMNDLIHNISLNYGIENWSYSNKSTFKSKEVTNIEVNVIGKDISADETIYFKVRSLQGISLGNHNLRLIGYEVVQTEFTEEEPPHHHYKIQVYNEADVDISSDVTIQLGITRQ